MALGIFGLPIPDETILTFSGFFVFLQKLQYIPTVASAMLGSITGVSLGFLIGRKYGTRALIKFGPFLHINEEKLDKAKRWFESRGGWFLFFGYFIPGVRHLTAITAGSAKTKYLNFAVYAYSGCLLWTNLFIYLGYVSGKNWEKVKDKIQGHILFIVFIIILLLAVYTITERILRKRIK